MIRETAFFASWTDADLLEEAVRVVNAGARDPNELVELTVDRAFNPAFVTLGRAAVGDGSPDWIEFSQRIRAALDALNGPPTPDDTR